MVEENKVIKKKKLEVGEGALAVERRRNLFELSDELIAEKSDDPSVKKGKVGKRIFRRRPEPVEPSLKISEGISNKRE
jgi:hypothetical protein